VGARLRLVRPRTATEDAAVALEQALDRYERKKNLAIVAQVKPKLEALRQKMAT
jgi:exonuclease VII small subunit